MLLRTLAPWMALAVCVLLLLGSLAQGTDMLPAEPDVKLELGPYFFNPSIVQHRGVYLATARTAHMKRIDKTNWWFNEGYICMSTTSDFKSVSCRKFDPWQGRFTECLWGSERQIAWVDTQGIEDPKLFVWPGKGVYAVFGRKPEALGASPYCRDPIFVQFFVQVVAENVTDEWSVHRPRELKPGQYAAQLWKGPGAPAGPVKEKNWMPFVHEDKLYMVHSVYPHRVFRVNSSGHAVEQHLTVDHTLFAPYKDEDIHGGPPVAFVPAHVTPTGQSYFLGIFHFFQTFGTGIHLVKAYHHYAYKMEARPPFRICAISAEIPLVTRKTPKSAQQKADWTKQRIWKDTSQTAYISGLYVRENGHVLMSYGSSDIDARLLTMSMAQLEELFSGSTYDCSNNQVLDAPAEARAAVAADTSSSGAARHAVINGASSQAQRLLEVKDGGAESHELHHRKHRRPHDRKVAAVRRQGQ